MTDTASPTCCGPESNTGMTFDGRNTISESGTVSMRLRLATSGRAVVEVFDDQGVRVRTLLDTSDGSGETRLAWDGTDASGRRMKSGVYAIRVLAPGVDRNVKVLVLR